MAIIIDQLGQSSRLFGTIENDDISGLDLNDTLLGRRGDDVLRGGSGNDVLKGGPGEDTLNGGEGDDVINGASGDDIIIGSSGNDLIDGNRGFNTLDYSNLGAAITVDGARVIKDGLGTDFVTNVIDVIGDPTQINTIDAGDFDLLDPTISIVVNLQKEFIDTFTSIGVFESIVENFSNVRGTQNADVIVGSAGVNNLFGDGGDDAIFGKSGQDTLDGGEGNDRIFGDNGRDILDGGEGNDILDGGNGKDTLIGSEGDDELIGGDGIDTIDYSNLGASIRFTTDGDIFKEGLGTDTNFLNEIIIGDASQNNVIDGTNAVSIEPTASVTIDLSQDIATINTEFGDFSITIRNFNTAIGTVNDDIITGDENANTFIGSAGNDTYLSPDGIDNDTFDYSNLGVGITFDAFGILKDGLGRDTVQFVQTLIGDPTQINTIDASEVSLFVPDISADINLADGVAITSSSLFDDQIFFFENFVNAIGTTNDDSISGDDNDNTLAGDNGNDFLSGKGGNDVIFGGDGDDTLAGNGRLDSLIGGNGDDFLRGGGGDDVLNGVGTDFGANDFDQLKGGNDADRYILGTDTHVFYEGIGFAEILGFETGIDKVQLNGVEGDYIFDNNSIIAGGDLIATFDTNFDVATDFEFVPEVSIWLPEVEVGA